MKHLGLQFQISPCTLMTFTPKTPWGFHSKGPRMILLWFWQWKARVTLVKYIKNIFHTLTIFQEQRLYYSNTVPRKGCSFHSSTLEFACLNEWRKRLENTSEYDSQEQKPTEDRNLIIGLYNSVSLLYLLIITTQL